MLRFPRGVNIARNRAEQFRKHLCRLAKPILNLDNHLQAKHGYPGYLMHDVPIPICDRVWINAHLATMDAAISAPYGALLDHALGVHEGTISWIASMKEISRERLTGEVIDVRRAWITPGLIDCHTHLVYGGNRAREIAMRLAGATYAEIARQGGGILATVRATRALDESQLLDESLPRLRTLAAEGVTTVEIKSGYGLTLDEELKMLRVARRLGECVPVNVRTTLLAAHALPPEYAGRADDYIDYVCRKMIPARQRQKLADAVDVFCEGIAFSPRAVRAGFRRQQRGMGCRSRGTSSSSRTSAARNWPQSSRRSRPIISNISTTPASVRLPRRARWRCLLPGAYYLPPRDAEAARPGASRGRRADGRGQRPESRHVAHRLAAADAQHGLRRCSA